MEVFIKVSIKSVLVINLEEDKICLCLAALFADSQIKYGGANISIKSSLFYGNSFFLCVLSSI